MRAARVLAWMPTEPSVRVMARATAEAAARGAGLRVLSLAAPPPQWPSWQRAASSQGIEASWRVVASAAPGSTAPEALHELGKAALVVTEASGLRDMVDPPVSSAAVVARADVYVVAQARVSSRPRMHEPAVVVGVSDDPGDVHLVGAAAVEAQLRRRHLVVLHARLRAVRGVDHRMEHRWLDALASFTQASPGFLPAQVVVTHRPVVNALRDHVDSEDVLVLGVRPGCPPQEDPVVGALLSAPPCDLLLTRRSARPTGGLRPVADEGSHARGAAWHQLPAEALVPPDHDGGRQVTGEPAVATD
ncbi:hypothetical protein [Pedococcus bigeumensis]|uniref:hypothetical protein n=1 Tax=Pedococcus bigeumensis TaxID=433644 RepID=UPI0031CFBFDA